MKVFAYYLPQYHRVPINDKWWGEGFTEWISVRNAKPLYEGHYQPREPMNDNYYSLLDKETMEWQADLMHEYGIDGMCFYHYWFSSEEQVLEKPAENLLVWKNIDMPFCFSWANESWLNKWSSREGFAWTDNEKEKKSELKYIFLQTYGRENEWREHFEYLLPFFKDERYIKYNDKPLFVIHDVYTIPCLHEMLRLWNDMAIYNGFKGIYVIGGGIPDIYSCVDAYMTHEPGNVKKYINTYASMPSRYSYKEASETILEQKYYKGTTMMYSTFCSYDTTPRYGKDGDVYEYVTPEFFCEHLSRLMAKNHMAGVDMVFIDAWNEWGEGMHLEPDEKYGFRWLEAVKQAKNDYKNYEADYRDIQYVTEYEKKVLCNVKKGELYGTILSRWMTLRENNVNVTDYLFTAGIERVVLYGLGIFSNHFLWECIRNNIDVVGAVDKSIHFVLENITLYQMTDKLPEADAIIITAPYYTDSICEEIRKYDKDIKIISIYELIILAEEKLIKR